MLELREEQHQQKCSMPGERELQRGEEEEKKEEEKKEEEAIMRKQFHWTEKAAVN